MNPGGERQPRGLWQPTQGTLTWNILTKCDSDNINYWNIPLTMRGLGEDTDNEISGFGDSDNEMSAEGGGFWHWTEWGRRGILTAKIELCQNLHGLRLPENAHWSVLIGWCITLTYCDMLFSCSPWPAIWWCSYPQGSELWALTCVSENASVLLHHGRPIWCISTVCSTCK